MMLWPWLALVALLTPPPPPDVATVTDLRGTVQLRRGADVPWDAARLDDGLKVDDAVRTHPRSAAELRFVDGTVLLLGESTRISIRLALFNPDRAPPEIQVALAQGKVESTAGGAPLTIVGPNDHRVVLSPGDTVSLDPEAGRLRHTTGGVPTGNRAPPGEASPGVPGTLSPLDPLPRVEPTGADPGGAPPTPARPNPPLEDPRSDEAPLSPRVPGLEPVGAAVPEPLAAPAFPDDRVAAGPGRHLPHVPERGTPALNPFELGNLGNLGAIDTGGGGGAPDDPLPVEPGRTGVRIRVRAR